MHKILGILVFTQHRLVATYIPISPILKGHAIQEQMEPIVCPETLVLTTNLHCVKSQKSEDFIYAMAES
jgi:hypothetical protein